VPVLSVIVPVYGVAEYLATCLDSILEFEGDALEVVAVDDASPDESAKILASYADPRLTVVTLASNRGLGEARNTGLDHATGDYVWFVDGDDWLPPGTVSAVLDRLAATTPDVLIVDYERVFPSGATEPATAASLDDRTWPDSFTLVQRPALLKSLHIACNKVVRRSFLVESGIRFGPGWYEDVSFSIPLVLAGQRLSLLSRNCYNYRQRLGLSITRTVTDRHFEVFPHWERVFAYLSAHPSPCEPLVFSRMIWHLLAVLSKSDRIPPGRRRDFFLGITRLYREHRPVSYPVGSLSDRVVHRLIALGAYRAYDTGRRVENGVRAIVRRVH
jgi:glycosyltransferase involved in cell wall biosynthesis